MLIHEAPRILSQHVDTLVVGFTLADATHYQKYTSLLDQLQAGKERAQAKEHELTRYVQHDFGLDLGVFHLFDKGLGRYAYRVENEDMILMIGRFKFKSDLPHIVVKFRSVFLFSLGASECIRLADELIHQLIGPTHRQLNEIHLATDVQGITYTRSDINRFQTLLGNKEYLDATQYGRHGRVQGYHFGIGDFLFRIYDKTRKIAHSPSESFIVNKWIAAGYDPTKKLPVQRHEVQLRRAKIKDFCHNKPKDCDELDYLMDRLSDLWFYSIGKLSFVNLTSNEIERLENSQNPNTKRSIFHRAKGDPKRFHFWDTLRVWNYTLTFQGMAPYEAVRSAKKKTAERLLKGFISSTYKALGCNPFEASHILLELNDELLKAEGINLHEYATAKVASSFVKSHRTILKHGINPEHDYSLVARASLSEFRSALASMKNPKALKAIKEALVLLELEEHSYLNLGVAS